MIRFTAADAVLLLLSREQRHVLSRWRSLVLFRRASLSLPQNQRRWRKLPRYLSDTYPLIGGMVDRGQLAPLPGLDTVFQVIVPYAIDEAIDEREVLFELNPYAALSHYSALVFHGLTEANPNSMMATVPRSVSTDIMPVGTTSEDWEGIARPPVRRPSAILGRPVSWVLTDPHRIFGVVEYSNLGYPIRVTNLERTLIDALRHPEECGGMANVLRAWATANLSIDVDLLIPMVDRFDTQLLRQRVGYLLDQLELSHPELEQWQRNAKRGGSSKLFPSAPFASEYDERWSLSLNGPIDALHDAL